MCGRYFSDMGGDVMTLEEAINARRSRRKYLGTPIEPSITDKLRELATEYSLGANLRIELVFNDGKAFNGFAMNYGLFSGVNDYIGLISDKNDLNNNERLGYYGELLILHSTAMGLGSCWVGGTFSRSLCPFPMTESEALVCAITIGNVAESLSFKERFIRNMTHRKTKAVDEMFEADAPVPDWFLRGMASVQKAPSAINRQPVAFSYNDGVVSASVKDSSDPALALDFGIAKLHFEIGAGGGEWSWGNNGGFAQCQTHEG